MPKRILFVDDEPDVLSVVTFRLKKAGYEVLNATNGQDGLDLALQHKPDLVLLDLRLPILSGEEVCLQIKAIEEMKHIPVILFTASVENLEERVKSLGAQGYLTKPFDPDKLLEKIKAFIG